MKIPKQDEWLLKEYAATQLGQTLEVRLPESATQGRASRYLAFEARIEAKRYRSGSNPCLQVAVNGLFTTAERLRNKRRHYLYTSEQRIPWFQPTGAAWTIPYHPWDQRNVAHGQAHVFVLDITNLLRDQSNAVTFGSTLSVHDAFVELRNVRLLAHERFARTPDVAEPDPVAESSGLSRFREKALGYHRGAAVKLNTGNPYKPVVGEVSPRSSFKQHYRLSVDGDGKARISFAGDDYVLQSHFLFPGLGWREIGPPDARRGWDALEVSRDRITAQNPTAALERTFVRHDSHVEIRDRFTNKTDADLPVVVLNCLDVGDVNALTEFRIAGMSHDRFWASTSPTTDTQFATTPLVYLARRTSAVGIVVEDDAYRNQASILAWDSILGVGDDLFYLGPRASYTFAWKVFPVPDRNYYTLVNAVRHDWGLFQRIPGLFGFVQPHSNERFLESVRVEKTPAHIAAFIRDTGMAFNSAISVHPDREGKPTPLFGNEKLEVIREGLGPFNDWRRKAAEGGAKAQFLPYVNAHLCRILDGETLADAEKRLPDCLIRDAFGGPVAYRAGWLYCFLPTLDNACGRHLLDVLRLHLDEQKFDGIYLDEWNHSRARISFNHHDGVSALLSDDGRILRKVGIVPILTREFQVRFVEEVRKRGGILFANQFDDTLTAAQLPIIHFAEPAFSYDSPLLAAAQVSRTPHSLHVHQTKGVWNDAKEFLKRGILMCFYWRYLRGDHVLRRCYPITVRELWPGVIIGEDRIVTSCSGTFTLGRTDPLTAYVYGGPDGLLADARRANSALRGQKAIELRLNEDQIAVILEDAAQGAPGP